MKFEIPVEIKSTEIREKSGTSRLGKRFHIREQFGYIDLGKAYPTEICVSLAENAMPYAAGHYVIDPACLYVDHYGQLHLGRLKLVPLPDQKAG